MICMSILPDLLSCACIPKILRTSESDFSPTHSPYLQRRKPLDTGYPLAHPGTLLAQLNECGNVVIIYKLLVGLRNSNSSPSETLFIFVLPSLSRGLYLALISTRLGLTFYSLGCILPPCVLTRTLQIFRFLKNTCPTGSSENVSIPHTSSRNLPDTENLNESTIPLDIQVRWIVQFFLRGLTWFICVSAEHLPPFYQV